MTGARPSFLLTFKLKGRPNRARPDEAIDRERVLLGSRPLADIYVPDRLVAAEALSFEFDGATVTLDVHDDLAGVFVDGKPVSGRGRLADGAAVQVGHALVEVSVNPAAAVCTLTTTEMYLPSIVDGIVKTARPARPFALVDSGPQEHRWGVHPILRRANWAVALLGVAALAALPFLTDTDVLSRGELAAAHAIGSSEDAPQSCQDCHSPFGRDDVALCAKCHEDTNSTRLHPYDEVDRFTCSACHMDHRGADADLLPAARRGPGDRPLVCGHCHDVESPSDVMFSNRRPRAVKDDPGAAVGRALDVDGFSHRDHRVAAAASRTSAVPLPPSEGKVPVACEECHRRAEGAPPTPTAEFDTVPYERCLDCHADWSVSVHGRDHGGAGCYVCHASAATPAEIGARMRTVELFETGSRWALPARRHDFSNDECADCHVRERQPRETEPTLVETTFRHDHHLPTVDVPFGGGLVFSELCLACHHSVAGSESLSGTPLVNTSSCGECHTDAEPVPIAPPPGSRRIVVDMFHRVHTMRPEETGRGARRSLADRSRLSAGCLACHVPVPGAKPMAVREWAADCSGCHTSHANIGQGKCVLCHVDRDNDDNRDALGRLDFVYLEAGIFERGKAVQKQTLALPRFDHGSPGHDGHPCEECHDTAAVDASERVLDVPWPAHDADACVSCHTRERYHR